MQLSSRRIRLIFNDDKDYWNLRVTIHLLTGDPVGFIGFQGHPSIITKWAGKGETQFGYELDEVYRNKGYATEAGRLLLNWGFNRSFQNLEVVKAHTIHGWRHFGQTTQGNIASNKVLEKLGAIYDGHHHDDKAGEVLIWRISKENFNAINTVNIRP